MQRQQCLLQADPVCSGSQRLQQRSQTRFDSICSSQSASADSSATRGSVTAPVPMDQRWRRSIQPSTQPAGASNKLPAKTITQCSPWLAHSCPVTARPSCCLLPHHTASGVQCSREHGPLALNTSEEPLELCEMVAGQQRGYTTSLASSIPAPKLDTPTN